MVLGAMVSLDPKTSDVAARLVDAHGSNSPLSYFWLKMSDYLTLVAGKALFTGQLLGENTSIVVYAVLALVGASMSFLIIRSGKKTPEEETKIESLVKDLRYEKEKAQNLAKLKSEFLNQVSHELRTPLAVIMGYVDCMIDGLYGQIEVKHKDILKVVSKQSIDLKEMIDRILVFSRLEADKARLRIETFPINKIVNDLIETYDFIGRQKGVEMRWQVPNETIAVTSDPERLKEILNNLLQNAVKFTSDGAVSIKLEQLSDTGSVELEVSDTGIGIPSQHLNSIFDPFFQVNKTSTTNSKGGIGLGLSIVKKHVEQLRGTLRVQSEIGKGTTFKIIIPRVYEEMVENQTQASRLMKLLRGKKAIANRRPSSMRQTDVPLPKVSQASR
jgi:signal transduction histidine kinase